MEDATISGALRRPPDSRAFARPAVRRLVGAAMGPVIAGRTKINGKQGREDACEQKVGDDFPGFHGE